MGDEDRFGWGVDIDGLPRLKAGARGGSEQSTNWGSRGSFHACGTSTALSTRRCGYNFDTARAGRADRRIDYWRYAELCSGPDKGSLQERTSQHRLHVRRRSRRGSTSKGRTVSSCWTCRYRREAHRANSRACIHRLGSTKAAQVTLLLPPGVFRDEGL